jgi:hypothetical protein
MVVVLAQEMLSPPAWISQLTRLATTLEGVQGSEAVEISENSRFLFLYGGPDCSDAGAGQQMFARLRTKAKVEGLEVRLYSRGCFRILVPRRNPVGEGVHRLLTLVMKGEKDAQIIKATPTDRTAVCDTPIQENGF